MFKARARWSALMRQFSSVACRSRGRWLKDGTIESQDNCGCRMPQQNRRARASAALQRLEVFQNGVLLVVGQLVRERMSGGALARLARVEEFALLRRRFDSPREPFEGRHFEADARAVVASFGARPDGRSILASTQVP